MRLLRFVLIVPFLAACTPAQFARELKLRNNEIHRAPVEAVKQIESATNGGDATSRPGAPGNVSVPIDRMRAVPEDTAANGASIHNRCDIPGKSGSASATCLGRYDFIKMGPRKKGPVANTQR